VYNHVHAIGVSVLFPLELSGWYLQFHLVIIAKYLYKTFLPYIIRFLCSNKTMSTARCYELIVFKLLTTCMLTLITHIGGVLVSVIASSAVDRGFEPRSNQTKDYKIWYFCLSVKHTTLRRKSKYSLARNRDVSEWGDMSISGLLFSEVAL
jgi:hypothetical protein